MTGATLLSACVVLAIAQQLWPAQRQSNGASAFSGAGCTLRIHVDGLHNSKGKVGTVIFATPDGWPEDRAKSFRNGPTDIKPNERHATAVWEHLPPGDYAVAAIHDENSNAKLDRNFLGIPKEGFGFANNPHVVLAPAPFNAALVRIACPVTEITIQLQYK